MVKQAVKVVIRARPTASFASKNIKLDPLTGVRRLLLMMCNRLSLSALTRERMREWSTTRRILGSSNSRRSSTTVGKELHRVTAPDIVKMRCTRRAHKN